MKMNLLIKTKKLAGKTKRFLFGILLDKFEICPDLPEEVNKSLLTTTKTNENIYLYKIGKGSSKVLFLSAIHGNEVGTVKLQSYLINFLKDSNLLSKNSFYFIPCLNVEGYKLAKAHPDYFNGGNVGRNNKSNVDLNRNFPTKSFKSNSTWNFGKDYSEEREAFAGDKPLSEKETYALIDLIKKENVKTIISFHNSGRDVTASNNGGSKKLAKIFVNKTKFKLVCEADWKKINQSGTLKEWCDENNKIYLEIEGTTRWGSDWNNQREGLIAILESL